MHITYIFERLQISDQNRDPSVIININNGIGQCMIGFYQRRSLGLEQSEITMIFLIKMRAYPGDQIAVIQQVTAWCLTCSIVYEFMLSLGQTKSKFNCIQSAMKES